MGDNEEKAKKLLMEADKKAKGGGGGFFEKLMGGGSTRIDEACELYVRGANLFKMAKKWNEAGQAFVQSAELHASKTDAKHDAAMNYVDAANCFKKTNLQSAIDCMLKAVEIYTDMGRFTMAAKHHTTIAEMYESDNPDLEKSMLHYEKAGDYYQGEESKTFDLSQSFNLWEVVSANKCYLKVAEYAATLEQYPKAIQIFEQVGQAASESSLLKYSAKDYFFKALLCHLCVDIINAQHALQKVTEGHPNFKDSRECKLISDLILCCEEQNTEQFTASVQNYDKVSRLDQWTTTILLRIKKANGEDEDLR